MMANIRRTVFNSYGVPSRIAPCRSRSSRSATISPFLKVVILGFEEFASASSFTIQTMRIKLPYNGTSFLYIADMANAKEVRRSSASTYSFWLLSAILVSEDTIFDNMNDIWFKLGVIARRLRTIIFFCYFFYIVLLLHTYMYIVYNRIEPNRNTLTPTMHGPTWVWPVEAVRLFDARYPAPERRKRHRITYTLQTTLGGNRGSPLTHFSRQLCLSWRVVYCTYS